VPALALVEEASNRLFDQFIAAPIAAASEFLLDLFCQIRRQRNILTASSLHSTC